MKIKAFTVFITILSVAFAISAQDKKGKGKKKVENDTPQLTVVKMQEPTPVAAVPVPQKTANGSLFTDDAANGSLLVDFKAHRIGDLVFVDVVESNTATVASSANRKRDSGDVAGLGTLTGALPIGGAAVAGSVVNALGQRKFDGSGTTQRNSTVRARIAARVVEVLPNGDMRIEALKLVKINKEVEQLAVSGIVRRNDLAADNSVSTVAIGDLRVEFNGKGIASADNQPGWLYRMFEKITPF